MNTKKFKYDDGVEFEVDFELIGGYHYVKVMSKDIESQLPAILKTIKGTKPNYITWHWTAGSYTQPYNHYQINIGVDYVLVNLYMLDYSYFGHTWKRNSGNLGMSYMAMGGAVTKGIYQYDIRKAPSMVEAGSKALAVIVDHLGVNWSIITDHDAWSKRDGYDSYRWDNQLKMPSGKTLFTETIEKAKDYYNKFNQKGKQEVSKTPDDSKHEAVKAAPPVCTHDTPFDDVNCNMWYADAVQNVYDLGLLAGKKTEDGGLSFDPDGKVTRAELAVVLDKLIKHIKGDAVAE